MLNENSHLETGKKGEQLAVDYLISNGYQILERNWRYSKAEIDLIVRDQELLVFVEVKTRTSDYFGPPESFVSEYKEVLIQEAASAYMDEINYDWEIRFDIISILINADGTHTLNHFKDAF